MVRTLPQPPSSILFSFFLSPFLSSLPSVHCAVVFCSRTWAATSLASPLWNAPLPSLPVPLHCRLHCWEQPLALVSGCRHQDCLLGAGSSRALSSPWLGTSPGLCQLGGAEGVGFSQEGPLQRAGGGGCSHDLWRGCYASPSTAFPELQSGHII